MIRALVEAALRFRGVVIALAAAVAGFGLLAASRAKLDVFPEFVQPQVTVQTEAPGYAAEQVEALVTRPVEAALLGLTALEAVRSQSIQGLSVVTALFAEDADVFRARQLLSERLAETAGQLPPGVGAPRMTPLTSSTMDLLKIGLLSERLTPSELRSFAEWTLRPRLRAVPGVANVSLFGGDLRQLRVEVRPDRLAAYGLTIGEVAAAVRSATAVRGAGFVETPAQRIVVDAEAQVWEPGDLARAVVATREGRAVRVEDLGRVVEAAAPKFGDALVQGRPGVLLTMLSQYGANTMEVTRDVEAALAEMAPTFERMGITLLPRLHRPANFVETAVSSLRNALLVGALLVAAVLFLFLKDVRSAFISLTAIPLSLLLAVILLERCGITLNAMTLGGLAIALGEVVDDAIIDVENIGRRLRQRSGRPALETVLAASLEVRGAIVHATLVVVLVFLPVLTMSGLQGRMFAPLALAYILAVVASLAVALTVTPALALALLPRHASESRERRWVAAARRAYERALRRLAPHPWRIAAPAFLLCGAALALLPFLRTEFLPEFREGHFVLHVNAVPGTSLPEMLRIGKLLSDEMLADPRIASVEQQVGRSELGEDPWGPHRSEFHVELSPASGRVQEEVRDSIRATLARFPGISYDVMTLLEDRIGETLTGETASVVVSVFGEDLDLLDRKADEIARVLASVPGAVEIQRPSLPTQPQVNVRLRREELRRFRIPAEDVLDVLAAATQGTTVARSFRAQQQCDVVVALDSRARSEPEAIGSLLVRNSVPLRLLADVDEETGRTMVLREGGRRRQTVTCNVEGRDTSSFVAEAKRRMARDVTLPPGSYVSFGGEAEASAAARTELLTHAAIAALGIALVLATAFRARRNLLLVAANLPFALAGGALAVALTGLPLSMGALVGFVTLFGITTRNSIMLVSHFEHLTAVEGLEWGAEAAVRGASERLVPILMTAAVTALALLPIALGSGEAGREIEGPMAVVITGGLVTSTLLNLAVLPSLALRFGSFPRPA